MSVYSDNSKAGEIRRRKAIGSQVRNDETASCRRRHLIRNLCVFISFLLGKPLKLLNDMEEYSFTITEETETIDHLGLMEVSIEELLNGIIVLAIIVSIILLTIIMLRKYICLNKTEGLKLIEEIKTDYRKTKTGTIGLTCLIGAVIYMCLMFYKTFSVMKLDVSKEEMMVSPEHVAIYYALLSIMFALTAAVEITERKNIDLLGKVSIGVQAMSLVTVVLFVMVISWVPLEIAEVVLIVLYAIQICRKRIKLAAANLSWAIALYGISTYSMLMGIWVSVG